MLMAIVSRGPSNRLYQGRGYDIVVGVRDVVEKWPCTYWALVDVLEYPKINPIGRPTIWAPDHVPLKIYRGGFIDPKDEARFKRERVVVIDQVLPADLISNEGINDRWTRFTGTAALGLAAYLRPDRVDVYGMDLAGTGDYRGEARTDGGSRAETRWRKERLIVDRLVRKIEEAGTVVTFKR